MSKKIKHPSAYGPHRDRVKPEKLEYAREMRKNPTPSEAKLWERLRKRRLGDYKFRRQAILYGWIADFWCPQVRVVVEVDGKYHERRKRKDEKRDAVMEGHHIAVVRVKAEDVMNRIDSVLRRIKAVCNARAG